MRKNVIFLAVLAVESAAWACPDFTGTFATVDAVPRTELSIRQTQCERLQLEYRTDGLPETARTVRVHGKKYREVETPDMTTDSTYTWNGEVITMQQETRWKQDGNRISARGVLKFDSAGRWVEETQFFDGAGAELGTSQQVYQRKASRR